MGIDVDLKQCLNKLENLKSDLRYSDIEPKNKSKIERYIKKIMLLIQIQINK